MVQNFAVIFLLISSTQNFLIQKTKNATVQ